MKPGAANKPARRSSSNVTKMSRKALNLGIPDSFAVKRFWCQRQRPPARTSDQTRELAKDQRKSRSTPAQSGPGDAVVPAKRAGHLCRFIGKDIASLMPTTFAGDRDDDEGGAARASSKPALPTSRAGQAAQGLPPIAR